jgi:hypothetical protein
VIVVIVIVHAVNVAVTVMVAVEPEAVGLDDASVTARINRTARIVLFCNESWMLSLRRFSVLASSVRIVGKVGSVVASAVTSVVRRLLMLWMMPLSEF